MFLLNNKPLQPGVAFEHDGILYPANFLNLSSPEEKEAIGITEVTDQARPDDRYYWVTDNQDGTFIAIPKALDDKEEVDADGNPLFVQVYDPVLEKMVDTAVRLVTKGLKTQKIAEVKAVAGSILSQTDWMVTRKFERSVDIPATVVSHRAAVVAKADELEVLILAAMTVEDLIAIDYSFPASE